ncbi:hypothetical protein SASPL_131058 [Salvia splendens]|uniref:Uncharacterized protein n=1 Tax=Salvia splendens TaxID=180675 RepID=A0A8X8ZKI2_SALSN|nr:hypothetical protein SASPL_131058 [Salvia splendens]
MPQILSNFYPLAGRSHVDPHQLNQLLPLDLAVVDRNQGVWKLLVHPTGDRNLILKSFLTAKPYRNSGGGCLHLPLLRADIKRHGEPLAVIIWQLINIRERTVPPVQSTLFARGLPLLPLSSPQNKPRQTLKGRTFPVQADHDCAWVLGDKEFGWKLCSLAISSMAT